MLDKLRKVDFNKLKKNHKLMIPMVAFPFLILINGLSTFIFKTDLKAATPIMGTVSNQINAELQDPDLEKSQTKNKFDALFDAYDKKEDFSAIQDLEGLGNGNEKSMELDDKNLYSMSEMDMISKGNGNRLTGKNQSQAESNYSLFKNSASNSPSNGLGYSPKFATQGSQGLQPSRIDNTEVNKGYANYESHLNSMNNANGTNGANGANERNYEREAPRETKQSNPHEDNMALFRAQMAVIDSMTNKRKEKRNDKSQMNQTEKGELSEALNGSNESDNTKPLVKSSSKSAMNAEKIIEVSKTENDNSRFFNTIGLAKNNSFIKAILDEGLKVYDGSRVRIRLMDDIQFEGKTLERGTYLYGIISGFKTQRVLLTITNIAFNNEIINVKLDVFDQDGMKGLYIPESLFREIAKEASAQTVGGQNMQFSDNNALNATQMAYTAAQDIYKTTTRAMSDAIRKRKAVLKYNTQIFLVNSK